jgi:hypothetical protein
LTDPAKSPVLLAPLAKEAGGWGLCKGTASFRVPIKGARPIPMPIARRPAAPGSPAPAVFHTPGPADPFSQPATADPMWIEMMRKAKRRKRPVREPKAEPTIRMVTPTRAVRKEVDIVFESTDDPDYQRLLATIQAAKAELDAVTRFDMPNFRPNVHYIREMKRYGILPAAADPEKSRIDAYAVDEAYWQSLWHTPMKR